MPRSRRISSTSSRHTRSMAGASCLRVLGGDAIEHGVERLRRPMRASSRVTGSAPVALERAIELRLRLVEQAAARQRIHAHERLGLVPRLEPVDRRQQKLVRARREPLQRRQRVRTLAAGAARSSAACVPGATLIRPSLGDQAPRPRAQRLMTDRRSDSLSPSR